MKRRKFLKNTLKFSSSAFALSYFPFLNSLKAFANDGSPHFFLFVNVDGGMDCTLGLNPKVHSNGTTQKDIFLEYRPDEIIQVGNIALGPSAQSLKPHYNDILIINGVNMRRDAGHESLKTYISTGDGTGMTGAYPVQVAESTSMAPFGVVSDDSLHTGNSNLITTNFQELISTEGSVENDILNILNPDLIDNVNLSNAISSLKKGQKPLSVINKKLEVLMNDGADLNNLFTSAALIFSSLGAFQGNISLSNFDLDTHTNHVGQHIHQQRALWDYIANGIQAFKDTEFLNGSLLDYTTILVTTEFSRTPYLNVGNGKDHNPYTNSLLLAGKGVNTNQVIGASHVIKSSDNPNGYALNISTPIDFNTGQLIYKKEQMTNSTGLIFPEDLNKTISAIFGSPENYKVKDGAKIIPGVVK